MLCPQAVCFRGLLCYILDPEDVKIIRAVKGLALGAGNTEGFVFCQIFDMKLKRKAAFFQAIKYAF